MDSGYYAAMTRLVARTQALDTAAGNLRATQWGKGSVTTDCRLSPIILVCTVVLAGCSHINLTARPTAGPNSALQQPVITSALSAILVQGAMLTYQLAASGSPVVFSATDLPNGLAVDSSSGLISGVVSASGPATVQLAATNAYGTGHATLSLIPADTPTAVGSENNCEPGVAPPPPAASSGFLSLAFCDDFDSESTIDVGGTGGPGYNWYPYRPGNILARSAFSVANSALTISDTSFMNNWGLTTADIRSTNGRSFEFGYFEARVDFNPALGTEGEGWPAFWALSARAAESGLGMDDPTPHAELDFFEALPHNASPGNYYGTFAGTLHQWDYNSSSGLTDFRNSKNAVQPGTDWTQWHVIGCLWVRGQVTWYLDGVPLLTQAYGPNENGDPMAISDAGNVPAPQGVFDELDAENKGMLLILGSGPDWPMNVDWVRVWQ